MMELEPTTFCVATESSATCCRLVPLMQRVSTLAAPTT